MESVFSICLPITKHMPLLQWPAICLIVSNKYELHFAMAINYTFYLGVTFHWRASFTDHQRVPWSQSLSDFISVTFVSLSS